MSDTDDTDLLLLIPPDFFLVHSPGVDDFDSDCDTDFVLEHDEVKDSIVSDLITQVNDLESRICMIEHLDRSVTHCSMCNDDSFVNHSVNSLTESDVLRSQYKERENLSDNLMVKSFEQSLQSGADFLLPTFGTDRPIVNESETEATGIDQSKNKATSIAGNSVFGITDTELSVETQFQLRKINKSELVNEVDAFIAIQKNQKESPLILSSEKVLESKGVLSTTNSVLPTGPDNPPISGNNIPSDISLDFQQESLDLLQVHNLLREMERTQSEMEKKLQLHAQKTCSDTSIYNTSGGHNKMIHSSQIVGLEDLNSKTSKTVSVGVFNNQLEDINNKLKSIQGNKLQSVDMYKPNNSANTQISYLFSSRSPVYTNESKPKPLSPNRATTAGRNPIDIVKANLPKKGGYTVQFGNNKDSQSKDITSFRRQLSFEGPHSPFRRSVSRPLFHTEQNIASQNEAHKKTEDEISFSPRNNMDGRAVGGQSLEERFNTLAMQRAVNENGNQNPLCATENKTSSSENTQKKISSNNLLSLSELWNKEPTLDSDDPNKLRQKLEEEKYRRQHCEQQIQALQLRVLEEQEKLAVAIRVDQEKDRAILQITESWRKQNEHWNELEEQRNNLAHQLQEGKALAKVKSDELNKKAERWEKEVCQALDLAAGYKEKCEAVQKQIESMKKETDEKLSDTRTQLQNSSEQNTNLNEENKNLLQQLHLLQGRIAEEEELLSKLKVELEKSSKKLIEYDAEANLLKEQNETLSIKIKDERNRSSILEQKKNALQEAVNEANKKEKAAQEELRISNERMEVARTELKALYQGQLETVVKEKLQEFQTQLEVAEAALKAELHAKEKQWATKASDQYRQLKERYQMDLHRVEDSCKAEINKWKAKLIESERLRSINESRLQEETNRRADIAQRLHSVMETQWREALNIISNPMQNICEVQKDDSRVRWPSNSQSSERLKGSGDLKPSRSESTASLAHTDEAPFFKEGLVTCRTSQPSQDQLKKYIQMLLERGPGNPVSLNDTLQESFDDSCRQANPWMLEDPKKPTDHIHRMGQSGKPPWK